MEETDSKQQFNGGGGSPETEEGQWKLYEAYNELHGLAQEFSTPFDAPAVLVVGHQTEGKSALVEALMGFQFNHVGGGTKTRRPITLHMKFNPDCHTPLCHLLSESDPSIPQEKSLQEIQAYIEAENMRLERESYQFSSKEIIIRIEYKYCPNLTIIDTPGLIAPAPARKNRALQTQARAVESLVRAKMQHKEFIILCLEDCSDWSNATTRRVVMQIDPELSRTVVVSTKLDTKIPQFARASDVEVFLSPPASTLDGFMLGDSPFFTSVPSGRVGSEHESVYRSNDEFKQAISLREMEDRTALEEKLGRSLSKQERSRIGVSSLKLFLEELLQKRYMESVPLIIPLLEKEYRSTTRKLNEINQELSTLDEVKMKEKGRVFHDLFLTKLSLLLKGSVVAPPDKFGETLQDERVNGGAFIGTDGLQFPQKLIPEDVRSPDVHRNFTRAYSGFYLLVFSAVQNAGMRLYGGAQYHRAMAEFRLLLGNEMPSYYAKKLSMHVELRTSTMEQTIPACVIAVAKARDTFEPFLHQSCRGLENINSGETLTYLCHRLYQAKGFWSYWVVSLLYEFGWQVAAYSKEIAPNLCFSTPDGEYLSGHEVFLNRSPLPLTTLLNQQSDRAVKS
ncbi:hypothetical protein DH2020_011123 [Rehmannia glutinosa]|uniref:Dynamin-type G domain-containing protein n=1 Tax=Rehmannia glutinosa TaxID=99300 RepID=A0ABR0XCQ2_REHGL